jgi:hypothetical protein
MGCLNCADQAQKDGGRKFARRVNIARVAKMVKCFIYETIA